MQAMLARLPESGSGAYPVQIRLPCNSSVVLAAWVDRTYLAKGEGEKRF
jgi:hypothetical protein